MNEKHYIGRRVSSIEKYDETAPISGVALLLDENNEITAGDESSFMLEITCPYGTQAMANNLLASLRGKTYKGYRADNAPLPIEAELGDGVTVDGLYSLLAYRSVTFGPGHFSEIAAPGENELQHEYHYLTPTEKLQRKIATTNSRITKTAEMIRLEVENEVKGLSSSLELTASSLTAKINDVNSGLTSKIEQTASSLTTQINNTKTGLSSEIKQTSDSLTTKINAVDGRVTTVQQTVDGLTLSVTNGLDSSTIKLMSGSTTIASKEIKMTGLVTIEGLSSGKTTIDGACIKTGTIEAERLNLTGAITVGDLDNDMQTTLNTLGEWVYPGSTYIDGSKIMTGTVIANTIQGRTIYVLDNSNTLYGIITTGSYSGDAGSGTWVSSGINLRSYNNLTLSGDTVYLSAAGGRVALQYGRVWVQQGVELGGYYEGPVLDCAATVLPDSDNYLYSLGSYQYQWANVYTYFSHAVSSDLNLKEDVIYSLQRYDGFFDDLQPIHYLTTGIRDGLRHIGFGAQDVEQSLEDNGLTIRDFAGLVKNPKLDKESNIIPNEYVYSLRYGEFVALNTWQIQQLKKRVTDLEEKLRRVD